MKPLVIESFRHKEFEGIIYKRRLRISPFNAILIDKALGTFVQDNGYRTRFVVLDALEEHVRCSVFLIKKLIHILILI